ncbi:MAG: GNAT family N-acetyltransferase [Nocardioides sp.]|nr:GNAT family N-acetyltransferase [Nocardioides sp.]
MSRTSVQLREACLEDAAKLAELWIDVTRREPNDKMVADMELVIDRAMGESDDRLGIAESEGEVAGAVYLRATTISPVHLEPVVHTLAPHVFPQFRRRGVGHALIEAGVEFAEERGISHVAGASLSSSREAHRFLARLGMGPQAVFRIAATHVVRAKLTPRRPVRVQPNRQPLGQVLAQRRSLRRRREAV